MSKILSLEDLAKIKIDENGIIKEKSSEEIANMETEERRNNSNQLNALKVDHSIEIPTNIYKNIKTHVGNINLTAFAPYNFVPLNDRVVASNFRKDDVPFDHYHENKFTGYLSLQIISKTPIYLRDLLTEEESKIVDQLDKKLDSLDNKSMEFKEKFEQKMGIIKNFYSPGDGKFKISGSTLRGLTRNNVEIVSYSKIGFIDKDRKFHYRAMADMSVDLKEKFKNEMLDGDKNIGFFQTVKAGYLIKDGNNYKIKPAVKPNPVCEFFRVEEDTAQKVNTSNYPISAVVNGKREINPGYKIGFKKVKFTFQPYQKHTIPIYSQPLLFSKVDYIYDSTDPAAPSSAHEGVIVYSGWIPSKNKGKHLHWVIGKASNSTPLNFLPGVIEDYKNDEGRVKDANLLDWFIKFSTDEVPCFYKSEIVFENGKMIEKVKSFGHTGIFRLAYEKNLKDFIPAVHLDNNVIDISESIFGNETDFAGRIFFEDAELLKSESQNPLLNSCYLQTLSNPKPTTFQHYIIQQEISPEYRRDGEFQGLKGLKHYNSTDVSIRGNKIYWHKENVDFSASAEDIEKHLNQLTKAKCIDAGTTFTGRIRFENLSDVELGALLFALDLPQGCCHKIGMGKPLGLGSIHISPILHLSNRKNRYTAIDSEWTSELPESTEEEINIGHFKNKFASYILNALGISGSTWNDLWKVDRLNELKIMLDYDHKPDYNKTKYMSMQNKDFRNRPVLPKPSDVIKEE